MTNDMSRPTDATSAVLAPTKTSTGTPATPAPTSIFEVTDTVLDFARVAVLYILQETTLNQVATSQNLLQKFITKARPQAGGVTVEDARKVSLGTDITIDFVSLYINLGKGNVGGGAAGGRSKRRSL